MDNNCVFPRSDDGKGWAWGLKAAQPTEVWERFSPAYEAQAELLLAALALLWPDVTLDWAGSEDGEAAVARAADGTVKFCYHLEDPQAAMELAQAIADDRLDEFFKTIR
ncbi:hypothetical protein [Pseudochrobactrum sp. HB0163]|uniref:hypothetical protein n=1 Tax=Pseudochrobactrum sp. HB0163 TaxID=3450708 RepID=UPI003F6DDFED